MPSVQVVELRRLTNDLAVVPVVRYLLLPDGTVQAFPLAPGHEATIATIARDGIISPRGLLYPTDGAAFLAALPLAYSGSRFWATEPFAMEMGEDLTPPAPLSDAERGE